MGSGPVKDSRIKQLLVALALSGGGAAFAAEPAPGVAVSGMPAPAVPGHAQAKAGWELFGTYCTECHNADDWAGGVAFDTMSEADIPQNIDVFEKVVRKLRSQQMPPGGHKVPDKETRAALISWMEGNLDEAGKAHEDPGHVGLHRLNRKEYANAVRDLLGVEVDPSTLLPRDEPRDGFDNIAAALQVSPSFLDQYISAARTVVVQAMGNKDALPAGTTYRAQKPSTQLFHEDGLPLGTRGGIAVDHNFPADGEYVLNIANMAQALWVYNMEFENHAGGHARRQADLRDQHRRRRGHEGHRPEAGSGGRSHQQAPQEHPLHVDGGRAPASCVTFKHRTFAESEDRLQMYAPGGGQDRVLRVIIVRDPRPVQRHRRQRDRQPQADLQPLLSEERGGRRALRAKDHQHHRAPRLPSPGDRPRHAGADGLLHRGRKTGDFDAGVRRALTAVLAHPDFLFRAERRRRKPGPGHHLSHRRPDAGLAAVVLPVEQPAG